MKKYLAIARAELLDALQEKGEILIWVLLSIIPALIMSSVWLANANQVTVLTLSQLVTYYIVASAISWITEFWFDEYIHEEIRTGEFSRFLLKPIAFPFAFIFQNIGRKIFSIPIFLIPTVLFISLLFRQQLIFPQQKSLLLFAGALCVTFGIRFALSTLAAAGGFWWEHASALTHLRWVLEIVAGGYLLPISLYPSWMQEFPKLLPFQYIYYFPISIFTGTIPDNQIISGMIIGIIWMIFLIFLSKWVWRLGIKKYSAVGS